MRGRKTISDKVLCGQEGETLRVLLESSTFCASLLWRGSFDKVTYM